MNRLASLLILYSLALMSSPVDSFASASGDPSTNAAASASSCDNPDGDVDKSEVLLLPPSDPNSNIPSIKLGETIRFEEMGPVILGTDGSVKRIANWDILSEHEKKVTWRRISKRNEERRQVLLQKQQEEEAAAVNDTKEDK